MNSRKPAVKILCFVLCLVLLSTAVLSGIGVITLLSAGSYDGTGSLSTQRIANQVSMDMNSVIQDYFDPDDPQNPWNSYFSGGIYTGESTNFFYTIQDAQGHILLSTWPEDVRLIYPQSDTYWLEVTNPVYDTQLDVDTDFFLCDGVYYQYVTYTNGFVPITGAVTQDLMDVAELPVHVKDIGFYHDGDYFTWVDSISGFSLGEPPAESVLESFTITAGLMPGLPQWDGYAAIHQYCSMLEANRYGLLALCLISGVLGLIPLLLLCFQVGKVPGQEAPVLHPLFRIPADLGLVLGCLAELFLLGLFFSRPFSSGSYAFAFSIYATVTLLATLLGMWLLLLLCAQCRNHALRSHALIGWLVGLLVRMGRFLGRALPLTWKVMGCYSLYCLLSFLFLVALRAFHYIGGMGVLLWLGKSVLVGAGVLYVTLCFRRLKTGAEAIAAGDYNAKVSEDHLVLEFLDTAHTLNHIQDGMNAAVDSRMRSERLKTELITNVSHDLKTPLTSIVSYVDLLKQEPAGSPAAGEYLAVLDRQSQRLKKLIEDLVEASKASTGNLNLQLEPLDFDLLLSQALGEYVPRLEDAGLQLVQKLPETRAMVRADGRRLWRVFDNLLGNAVKYAMPGTRLYVNVETGDQVTAVFRNISREPLDVPAQELLERFVRGDTSRHTDGSGLGLSIAKSLTESMGGTFQLEVDADLFKATVSFPLLPEPPAPDPEPTEAPL